ncbi:MAG: hypothetical protein JXA20_11430 [Spirochaetes bacterium]|nr:hypothetical protein [Spirochaetota bacterium]
MTNATINALNGIRDLTTIKWYVIPLLAIVLYIYATETRKARETGNWEAVFAGLTLFGMDFINETWNGWVMALTQYSAFWTAPGDTALRTMVGWNIEIMFMFTIAGIIYYYALSKEQNLKILGLPEKWFWAIGFSIFCVVVECMLNAGGHLVWEYPFWYRSFAGVWLIFFFGYLHFFVAIIFMLWLKTTKKRLIFIGCLYAIAIVGNIIGQGILGLQY